MKKAACKSYNKTSKHQDNIFSCQEVPSVLINWQKVILDNNGEFQKTSMQIIQYLKNYLEVFKAGTAGVLNKKLKYWNEKKTTSLPMNKMKI